MKVVCFHNPNEENGYLSNWYMCNFNVNGIDYSSMEQYMMYQKAVYFMDFNTAEKILEIHDVAEIKSLGRTVKNFNNDVWAGVRQIIVYNGLVEKFSQNQTLMRQLKCTDNSLIAECAVIDKIWGIGLSMKDGDRFYPDRWRGNNLLGYALMMCRDRDKC